MPIPGFSHVTSPEIISSAEAVEMVMERFKSSACTEADARAWLNEQVQQRALKLLWIDRNPEYRSGLYLAQEGFIHIPDFPGARAHDVIDWSTGELRRQLRAPKPVSHEVRSIDPFKLTRDQLLARYGYKSPVEPAAAGGRADNVAADKRSPLDVMADTENELRRKGISGYWFHAIGHAIGPSCEGESEEWVTDELIFRFSVRRAPLVVILNRATIPLGTVPVRLLEAAEVVANRFCVCRRMGLDAIAQAAAAGRIEIYGKPQLGRQEDRGIAALFWRRVARGETDALAGEPGPGGWSDPYVFRADLEQLMAELAGGDTPAQPKVMAKKGRADHNSGPHPSGNAARTIRAAADFWVEAESEIMRWLRDNGFPAPYDGNQAKLERHILDWLAQREHTASEATARRHVRACIERYRQQVGAEAQNAAE